MNPANPLDTTELSVLVLAVNHYVRTSHYVGEPATILVFPNGTRSIAIPIFDSRPGATEDFERLKQRIDAIRPTFKAVGLNVTIEESPKGFGLTQHYLMFPAGAIQQLCLAGLLVSTRFPVRWGGPNATWSFSCNTSRCSIPTSKCWRLLSTGAPLQGAVSNLNAHRT